MTDEQRAKALETFNNEIVLNQMLGKNYKKIYKYLYYIPNEEVSNNNLSDNSVEILTYGYVPMIFSGKYDVKTPIRFVGNSGKDIEATAELLMRSNIHGVTFAMIDATPDTEVANVSDYVDDEHVVHFEQFFEEVDEEETEDDTEVIEDELITGDGEDNDIVVNTVDSDNTYTLLIMDKDKILFAFTGFNAYITDFNTNAINITNLIPCEEGILVYDCQSYYLVSYKGNIIYNKSNHIEYTLDEKDIVRGPVTDLKCIRSENNGGIIRNTCRFFDQVLHILTIQPSEDIE